MLSITRYRLDPHDEQADQRFVALATDALTVLAGRPGFLGGRLERNLDEQHLLALVTEWDLVGNYRRALGDPQVKMVVLPLLYQCLDEPSAYTDLLLVEPAGEVRTVGSDLAEPQHSRGNPYPGPLPGE